MAINVTCTCGNRIRSQTDFEEFLCPVCGRLFQQGDIERPPLPPLRKGGGEVPLSPQPDSGFVVYGFELPPASSPFMTEIGYRVLTVSEEKPPSPSKPVENAWPPVTAVDPRLADIYPKLDDKKLNVRRFVYVRPLENCWFDSLAYPFQAWALLLPLGFGLTLLTVMTIGFLRFDVEEARFITDPVAYVFSSMSLVAFAYTAGLFVCVFRAGTAGENPCVRWPAGDIGLAAKSLGYALFSFLAGPSLPAVVGVYFWIYNGYFELVDQAILLELAFVGIGYWLLVFLSITHSGSLKGAAPDAVLRFAHRLGPWCLLGPAVAFLLFLVHGPWALFAIETAHHTGIAWLMLFICWTSMLFCLTFLFRWLGVCVYQHKPAKREKTLQPVT